MFRPPQGTGKGEVDQNSALVRTTFGGVTIKGVVPLSQFLRDEDCRVSVSDTETVAGCCVFTETISSTYAGNLHLKGLTLDLPS